MMSDRVIQSVSNGETKQTSVSYQPVWMSRWIKTSSADRYHHSADGFLKDMEASTSADEVGMIPNRNFEAANISLGMSSKRLANWGFFDCLSKYGVQEIKPMFHGGFGCGQDGDPFQFPCWLPDNQKKFSTGCYSFDQGTSVNLPRGLTVPEKRESENYNSETMKIFTNVDHAEGISEAHSIATGARVSPSKGIDFLRTTQLINRNENTPSHLHIPSPLLVDGNRGLRLQELTSCSGEEKRDLCHVGTSRVATKNESSAKTDTLDLGPSTDKKSNSCGNSASSSKGFNDASHSSPQIRITSSREVGFQRKKAVLDVSVSLSVLPSGNKSTSSSRTLFLDRGTLISHAKLPYPEFEIFQDDSPKIDTDNRWVKRLKLSCSNSSGRARASIFSENLSHHKMRNRGSGMGSSEQSAMKRHGKEPILSGKIKPLAENPVKKNKNLLLSCSWIKRLLTSGSTITREMPETVVRDLQSSKMAHDDLQNKQFPSIAAMALLGRTMSGYQSCVLQKKGSVTVWNTTAF